MRTNSSRLIFVYLATLLAIGCDSVRDDANSGQSALSEIEQGHARMVAALAAIADDPSDPYLGDQFNNSIRRRLKNLRSGSAQPGKRLQLRTILGREELRMGRNESAIEQLTGAYAIVAERSDIPPDFVRHVRFSLAIAYMRWGETQNCVAMRRDESCIFPVRGTGVHQNKENSQNAIRYFLEILDDDPEDLPSRWLLNIAYMTTGGYPDEVPPEHRIDESLFDSEEPFPRFVDAAPRLGLDTFNLAGGAIAEDFDNDGWLDIMTSTWDSAGSIRYFRNTGDGAFVDSTESAGLTEILGGLNVVHADYDNDGFNDVLVLRGAWLFEKGLQPNSLLHNNGDGTFVDVTYSAGLADVNYPTQTAAWSDFDNDGDLDLYIGNEAVNSQLFINDGEGHFEDGARAAGVQNARFAKGVAWGDYDSDGYPDIFVSNLNGENRLYHNNQDGTFTDVAKEMGVLGPKNSFPAWFWDYDNDGVLDLYVATYTPDLPLLVSDFLQRGTARETAMLYRGTPGRRFEDVTRAQNVDYLTATMGANYGDLDNDGFLDFYLGTGFPEYEALMPNRMFRNRGGGGFSDVTTAGGFGHLQKGHAVTFADFDHDGDQDVFEQLGGFYPGDAYANVYFENPGSGRHWIKLQLVGQRSNRSAIGARIRIQITEKGVVRSIYRHVNSGGSFGSNSFRQDIGLGDAARIDVLEIYWPTTGIKQEFHDVGADRLLRIVEGRAHYEEIPLGSVGQQ